MLSLIIILNIYFLHIGVFEGFGKSTTNKLLQHYCMTTDRQTDQTRESWGGENKNWGWKNLLVKITKKTVFQNREVEYNNNNKTNKKAYYCQTFQFGDRWKWRGLSPPYKSSFSCLKNYSIEENNNWDTFSLVTTLELSISNRFRYTNSDFFLVSQALWPVFHLYKSIATTWNLISISTLMYVVVTVYL